MRSKKRCRTISLCLKISTILFWRPPRTTRRSASFCGNFRSRGLPAKTPYRGLARYQRRNASSESAAKGKIAINNRGLETLQLEPGENEDTAWRRMRSRLGTGKHLDETFIMQPSAVPTAHGSAPQPHPFVSGTPTPAPGSPPPPLGGGEPHPGPIGADLSGGLFGSGGVAGGARTPLTSAGSTSALNLMGKLESWNIGPATPVRNVRVTLSAATGAQLQKLLEESPRWPLPMPSIWSGRTVAHDAFARSLALIFQPLIQGMHGLP